MKHLDMPCTPEKVWRAINGLSEPPPAFESPGACRSRFGAHATGDEDIPGL